MTTNTNANERETTTHAWTGNGWSGTVEVPTDLVGEDQERWHEAMGCLASDECHVIPGGVVYLAPETGLWYRVSDADVLDLGERLLKPPETDVLGDGDVYSLWCSETMTSEHETLQDALGADTTWVPTHRITWTAGWPGEAPCQQYADEVMLVDEDGAGNGPAYTREEWDAASPAFHERTEDGWRFGGLSTPGGAIGEVIIEILTQDGYRAV